MTELADWTPPRYATPRDPGRATDGGRVSIVADALGTPFLPWQRYTANVAGERDESGRGYRYKVVVVTVPRQSGKTTLMRAVGVERCITYDDFGCFYTAQTGKDARARWADLAKQVKRSPFRTQVTIRQAAGQERLVFPNESVFQVFAPTASSLHGYTPPLVMLDESFAHSEAEGADLMGAIGPAQITLPHRQLWIVSTMGTAESVFFNRWVEAGRSGAPGVALFDWGAADGVDVFDPTQLAGFHPGCGTPEQVARGVALVTPEDIAAELGGDKMTPAEYVRAYGNRGTRTTSNIISLESWAALADAQMKPPPGRMVLAFDVAADRTSSTITGHWLSSDGSPCSRVIRRDVGMGWVLAALDDYRSRWRVAAVAAADNGPASELAARAAFTVHTVGGRDYSRAWGSLLEHLVTQTMAHDGSQLLADAATSVATRPTGDGTAAPSRKHSPGDISPVVSLMVGLWVLENRPTDQTPLIHLGSAS